MSPAELTLAEIERRMTGAVAFMIRRHEAMQRNHYQHMGVPVPGDEDVWAEWESTFKSA